MKHSFRALLESAGHGIDAAYVAIPFDVLKVYGTRGQVKVKATFDGYPYRGVMASMGTGRHVIGVRKEIRIAINKKVGDTVKVTVEQDTDPRVVEIPAELNRVLDKNKKAKSTFAALSFTNQKEYAQWISSAKKPETKKRRLDEIAIRLIQGKKNPSEK